MKLPMLSALLLVLLGNGSAAVAQTIVEDFTSRKNVDDARTTATWDTINAQVTLGPTRGRFGALFTDQGPDVELSGDANDFPRDHAIADLNGDGRVDAIYITDDANHLFVTPPGSELAAATSRPLNDNYFIDAGTVSVGDVDNDGDVDIFFGYNDNYSNDQRSFFYINDGTAQVLADPPQETEVALVTDVIDDSALADVNGDGRLDLLLATRNAGPIYYLNDGQLPVFGSSERHLLGNNRTSFDKLFVADFNNDGLMDVVVRSTTTSVGAFLHLNSGSAEPFASSAAGTLIDGSTLGRVTAMGDVNNDGFVDLAGWSNFSSESLIYINGGSTLLFDAAPTRIEHNFSPDIDRAMTDVNGDGLIDLLTIESGSLTAFINAGPPSYLSGTEQTMTAGFIPIVLGFADIDRDALPDSVYRTSQSPEGLRIHFNQQVDSAFSNSAAPINFGGGASITQAIAIADIDQNGALDVVTGEEGENYVYINNGAPLLSVGVSITQDTDETLAIAAVDVNGDDFPDVIAANAGLNRWYPNELGDGPFLRVDTGVPIGVLQMQTQAVAVGDLNGDNFPDIVMGNNGQNYLYFGTAGSTPFDSNSPATPLGALEANTRDIVISDFDGDGDADIATANLGLNYWYRNNGTNTPFSALSEAQPLGLDDDDSYGMALGDINLDTLPDLVVANNGLNRWYQALAAPLAFDPEVDGFLLGVESDASRAVVIAPDPSGATVVFANSQGAAPSLYAITEPTGQEGLVAIRLSEESFASTSIALGDINGDSTGDLVLGNFLAANQVVLAASDVAVTPVPNTYNLFANTIQSGPIAGIDEAITGVALLPDQTLPPNTGADHYVGTNPDAMTLATPGLIVSFDEPGENLYWRARLHSASPALTPVLNSMSFLVNPQDSDIDRIADASDNCTLAPNPEQRDVDGDGYGDICDADLNNDGTTNFADLEIFTQVIFTSSPSADFNADGVVDFADLAVMKRLFFTAPGPAGSLESE